MFYKNINKVPKSFRKLKGVPLSLKQINGIVEKAQADSKGPSDFAQTLAVSRDEFQRKHQTVNGVWVSVA